MSRPILIVGIGNEYRSDDGVGLVVARELQAKKLPHILVTECSGDGTELMEMWKIAATVILVDAVSSGAKPGTIYRLDALTKPIASFSFPSTHAFGVAEALGLARALDQLPLYLMIYAIEGKNFAVGKGLSLEVEKVVREVVERVASEVQYIVNLTNPRKWGKIMAQFDFIRERVSIVEDSDHRLDLNPQEALDLLQWLSKHKDALYRLAHLDSAQRQSREKRLEIHLYQENLEHVDKLKAAIPSLHEHKPVVKVLDAPMDQVTERALELLKELQVEYTIHPLLEEDNVFSQG